MKHILLTAILAAAVLLPVAPRCRLYHNSRGYYWECPCPGVTYQCGDIYPIGPVAPRPWIWR